MSSKLRSYEQELVELIQNPPSPKYSQWQEITQGRIVGLFFVSVGVAFYGFFEPNRDIEFEPGWHYHVEADTCQKVVAEYEIKP